ncbi:MAG: hypothetical protein ACTSW1_15845 [Candidatus Hodarchaeales archaeon]
MHERSYQIIKNLGYDDKIIAQLKKRKGSSRKTFAFLKGLGIPSLAIKQIKFLEDYPTKNLTNKDNKELIELLIKKCRRSLDAFANKKIEARIVFEDGDWTIYSDDYNQSIEKLHRICKPHFDEWCAIEVTFSFDGSNSWKVITKKESDLPGN